MSYDSNVGKWKKAYTDVLEVCERYPDFDNSYGFRDINDMRQNAQSHLMLIEWYEKYGLKIDHGDKPINSNYFKIGDYTVFSYYQDAKRDKEAGSGKYVSWSDDDRQPKDEWLFVISFATGAYIFGEDYDGQKSLFQDFVNELKSYKPDYSDTTNKTFYWKLENSQTIYNGFNGIISKYRERNGAELKQRKVEKLRAELEKLAPEALSSVGGSDE